MQKKLFLLIFGNKILQSSLSLFKASQVRKCTLVGEPLSQEKIPECGDGVYNYARTLCHYGALIVEFCDASAEGDGERAY